MYIYEVIAEIEKEVKGMYGATFFPETTIIRDTTKRYLAAYSGEHAIYHVSSGLKRVGWNVTRISLREIFLHDIRDSCDHVTD